ncbi:hypothetical protein NUW54_g756 [Trametes sanguinea]|uniref:Uncharacterized protein n=1 Tax=Trametes sanguinea TaxID=158606 RepID=A0ACC1QB11_9APHY|nr:hypothetical protein NUW54_g756 [Trametes sanguinea]
MDEIFKTSTGASAVENRLRIGGRKLVGEVERQWLRDGMMFGTGSIRFKKRDMEDRVKAREVGGETETVDNVGEFGIDRERTKTTVVKLVGGTRGLDMAA